MGEAASTITEEVVYVGRKAAGNGKLAHWYRALVDGELSDKEIGSYKPYTAAPVGAIVTINRPGPIRPKRSGTRTSGASSGISTGCPRSSPRRWTPWVPTSHASTRPSGRRC